LIYLISTRGITPPKQGLSSVQAGVRQTWPEGS